MEEVDKIRCVGIFYALGKAGKDYICEESFRIALPKDTNEKNEIHLKELDSISARYLNKSNRGYYILFSNIKHLYSYFLYGDEETKFVVDGKWRRYVCRN